MKKDIFVWVPAASNDVFNLVTINNKRVREVAEFDDVNIICKEKEGSVELYDRKNKDYKEFEIDGYGDYVLWTDVLDKFHEETSFDRSNAVHVFPVRLGVFSTNLFFELLKFSTGWGHKWYHYMFDSRDFDFAGDMVEKGYKVALAFLNNEKQETIELIGQAGLAEALGTTRQNVQHHYKKGNLLKPFAVVDGKPAWTRQQAEEMVKTRKEGGNENGNN